MTKSTTWITSMALSLLFSVLSGGCSRSSVPRHAGDGWFEPFDVSPMLTVRTDPEYPEQARRGGLEGWVGVEVLVGSDGRVKRARVLRSSDAVFESAALAAAKEFQFRPAERDRRPVRAAVLVPVWFRLAGVASHTRAASRWPTEKANLLCDLYIQRLASSLDGGAAVRFTDWVPESGRQIRALEIDQPYSEFRMGEGELYKFAVSGDLLDSAVAPTFIYPLYHGNQQVGAIEIESEYGGWNPHQRFVLWDKNEPERVQRLREIFQSKHVASVFVFGSGAFYVVSGDNTLDYFAGFKGHYDFSNDLEPLSQQEDLDLLVWRYASVEPKLIDIARKRTTFVEPAARHIIARIGRSFYERNVEFLSVVQHGAYDTSEYQTHWVLRFPEAEGAQYRFDGTIDGKGDLVEEFQLPDCVANASNCCVSVDREAAKAVAQETGLHDPHVSIWRPFLEFQNGSFVWFIGGQNRTREARTAVIDACTAEVLDVLDTAGLSGRH